MYCQYSLAIIVLRRSSTIALRLVLFALSLLYSVLPAQEHYNASRGLDPAKAISQYIHESWQTTNGLPQNSVQALYQTKDGYVWIGTQEGLARFDGMRFTVFNNKNSPLSDHFVFSLAGDHTGALWIGTRNGEILSLRNGRFTPYGKEQGYIATSTVRNILEDRAGRIWVATNGDGLFCLQNGMFSALTVNKGLLSNNVRAICEDAEGTLWIGTEKGLQCRTLGRENAVVGAWKAQYTMEQGLSDNNIYALARDSVGAMWIGAKNGLSRFSNGRLTTFTIAQGLPNNFIRGLLVDARGTLWIATLGGGVCRYANGVFSPYKRTDGLDADETYSLLSDREGELWVGTRDGGVHRFREGSYTAITTTNGLAGNNVRSVRQDQFGRMWVGSVGGVSRIDKGVRGDTVAMSFRDDSLAGVNLSSLFFDKDNRIWTGTNNKGLLRFTTQGTSLKMNVLSARIPLDTLLYGSLYAIIPADGEQGGMWIGTSKGITLTDAEGKSLRHYGKQEGLTDKTIKTMLYSRSGKLWIGGYTKTDGLFTYQNGIVKAFEGNGADEKRILPTNILTLYEDADTVLWVGTFNGLYRVAPNGTVSRLTVRDGLFDNLAFGIVEDEFGYLWMSCNAGIYRVKKSDMNEYVETPPEKRKLLTCTAYGTADGMKSSECNEGEPASVKSADGRLWFATIRGVVVVDPKLMVYNPIPPNVIIEEVRVDGVVSSKPFVQSEILQRKEVAANAVFEAKTEKFEFQYTAICLAAAERVKFKYLLEGYDKEWIEAGSRRTAYYNNLPRGKQYRFRVIACNNDGVWNETGAFVSFSIELFWWETWWFYTICGVLVVGIGVGGAYTRLQLIERQNQRLKELVGIQIEELQKSFWEIETSNREIQRQNAKLEEQARKIELANDELNSTNKSLADKNSELVELNNEKNEFLGIAAHDLKNPLTAIVLSTEILLDFSQSMNEEDRAKRLKKIGETAQYMNNIVTNLLDVNAIERGILRLNLEPINLTELSKHIVKDYRDRANAKNITVHFEAESEHLLALADKHTASKILDNVLSNAIKYSPQGKNVIVRVFAGTGTSCVSVQDEGAGLSEEDKAKLFGKFARLSARPTGGEHSTGLGLSIVKKLVEAMNGRVWCESELGKGATFTVELPLA